MESPSVAVPYAGGMRETVESSECSSSGGAWAGRRQTNPRALGNSGRAMGARRLVLETGIYQDEASASTGAWGSARIDCFDEYFGVRPAFA